MPFQQHKDAIGMIAGFFTTLQFLAPAFICYKIIKRGSSDGVNVMPFLGGFFLSVLFLQNSILLDDSNMINVNILTTTMAVIYLTTYFFYSNEKVKSGKKLGKAVIFLLVIILYVKYENPDVVNFRFGLFCSVALLYVIALPLFSFKEILRTRNTDALPMPIIAAGTAVSFSWLLYGVAIEDSLTQIQNLAALILSLLQVGLFLYCQLSKNPQRTSKKSKKRN